MDTSSGTPREAKLSSVSLCKTQRRVPPTQAKQQKLWPKGQTLEQNCQQATVEGPDPASLRNRLTPAPEPQRPPAEATLVPAKPLAIACCETHGQGMSQEAASAVVGEHHLWQCPGNQPPPGWCRPQTCVNPGRVLSGGSAAELGRVEQGWGSCEEADLPSFGGWMAADATHR